MMASQFSVPMMPGLRDLYAEDEQRVADMRAVTEEQNQRAREAQESAKNQRFLDAASEFLTRGRSSARAGKPADVPAPTGPAAMRAQENELRNQLAAQRRGQSSLSAYLQRQGLSPEDAALMVSNEKILSSWDAGRGKKEDRDWRAEQAQMDRDFRAGESAKDRASRLAAARLSAAEKKEPDRAKAATDLRKEFSAHPITKRYNDVRISYDKVQRAAKSGTAAGDISLIFGFMKLLDPGSVVREGEFATAQNAGGIPDKVRNAYNQALDGQRLNPEQRQAFVSEAGQAFSAEEAAYRQQEELFRRLAGAAGLDPSNVVGGSPAQRPTQGGNVDLTAPQGARPPPGMVRIRLPDGSTGSIPESELAAAEAEGAVRVP